MVVVDVSVVVLAGDLATVPVPSIRLVITSSKLYFEYICCCCCSCSGDGNSECLVAGDNVVMVLTVLTT